ncbi:MAG: TetR/AcrR family transcriptional regulator [Rhodoglobus sp.]
MTADAPQTPRETYHHGDLRQALMAAGLELAVEGGPDAVVLREATRRVGVSPNAAYRHFADREALLAAVCDAAQAQLAAAIEASYRAVAAGEAGAVARGHLRAVGTGYVRFALENPGLFRTAFSASSDLDRSATPERAGPGGLTAFQLVNAALDEFVASGIMPKSRRPYAEFVAWSSVHGAAMLLIDGPLRALDRTAANALTQHTIDTIEAGLTAP